MDWITEILGWCYARVFHGSAFWGFVTFSALIIVCFGLFWWHAIERYEASHPAQPVSITVPTTQVPPVRKDPIRPAEGATQTTRKHPQQRKSNITPAPNGASQVAKPEDCSIRIIGSDIHDNGGAGVMTNDPKGTCISETEIYRNRQGGVVVQRPQDGSIPIPKAQ